MGSASSANSRIVVQISSLRSFLGRRRGKRCQIVCSEQFQMHILAFIGNHALLCPEGDSDHRFCLISDAWQNGGLSRSQISLTFDQRAPKLGNNHGMSRNKSLYRLEQENRR
jgi:hypothetical protein